MIALLQRSVFCSIRGMLLPVNSLRNTDAEASTVSHEIPHHDDGFVSSQKLGAEKTDHLFESRKEAPSLSDDQCPQAMLPRIIGKIHGFDRFARFWNCFCTVACSNKQGE